MVSKRWLVGLALLGSLLLTACGGGGAVHDAGGGGGGGGDDGGILPPPASAEVSGTALVADGPLAASQAPLVGATVQVLDASGAVVATGLTDSAGGYRCGPGTGGTVPLDETLQVVAQTADGIVSGVVNSTGTSLTRHLDDVTHLAALALSQTGRQAVTEADIALYEQAARAVLEAELVANPGLRCTALAQQAAAAVLARRVVDAVAGGLVANRPPQVGQITTSPAQFVVDGGQVSVRVEATDGDGLTVHALVLRPGNPVPEAVELVDDGDGYQGEFEVASNLTTATQTTWVFIIVDDGRHAPVPQAIRQIVVRPDGRFVLDILTETLVDEPASRGQLEPLFDRLRPVYHRGPGRARTRQVNPNQTIRGATCTVVDDPTITGVTDNQGLLLLDVPLRLLNDRQIAIDARIDGRVPYRQYLLLTPTLAPADGDRIEIDLVLATTPQWQEVATATGLGTLDSAQVPLTAFFNVLNDLTLSEAAVAQRYRPITETIRADDGDYLYNGLPAGAVTATGTFTDPVDSVAIYPFGPLDLTLAAGHAHAVAALLPPPADE